MTNHDDPVLTPEDQLHADLCALAFGELQGDARAALEARIEAEPAVRVEYEAVRATIGLVQSNLGGDDALPAERMATVMAAAEGGPTPIHHLSWYQRPVVKMAAAAVLLAGVGLVGLRVFDGGPSAPEGETRTVDGSMAVADKSVESVRMDDAASAVSSSAPDPELTPRETAARARFGRIADEMSREVEGLGERLDRAGTDTQSYELHLASEARVVDSLAVDSRGLESQTLADVTQGLEDMAALGLENGGSGVDGTNAAGQPSAGFFYDQKADDAFGVTAQQWSEVRLRQRAEVQYIDPDTETLAIGGFNPGSSPSGARRGAGGGDASFDVLTVGSAGTAGEISLPNTRLNALGYGGGPGEAPAGTTGGEYRGPGDVSPPQGGAGGGGGAVSQVDRARGGSAPGSEDFFLGQAPRHEAQTRQGEAAPTESKGPASPGPSGPSSPGPAAPGAKPGGAPAGGRPVDLPQADTATPGTPAPSGAPAPEEELGEVVAERELERRARKKTGKVEAADDDELGDSLRSYLDRSANPRFTEQQLEAMAAERWRYVHDHCRRMPNERPRDMYFRFWGDNPFVDAANDAQSTFAADVDTASYALARRMLREGRLPVKAQIRTEEFVNAFTPDLPAPTEGTFGLHMELAPSPFSQDAYGEDAGRYLVRVGVRGKDVAPEERQPLNLTFVVDTSGSMREGGRLELVKHAMRLLVNELEPRDTIAVVAYSNEARQILLPTSASERNLIETAIHPLSPNGSTNAEAGLKMGYALAETMLKPGTHNRVVFLSDGVANVGQTDQNRIADDVKRLREKGIYLNTIGVGMSNHNDVFLEQLANKGDGICDYVDDAKGAEEAIVERFTGAFVAIAGDVKLQVEFDPTQVIRWRQLGYENRAVADKDFRNDKIDAGEVGAGHQVTCLYEVELAQPAEGADVPNLATLRVRWKAPREANQDPNEVDVFEEETGLSRDALVAPFEAASLGFRRSAYAAQFAEFLRRSSHARFDSYGDLVAGIGSLMDASRSNEPFMKELVELADLVRRADGLGLSRRMPVTDLQRSIEAYKRYQYLKATLDDLERAKDDDVLRQLEDTNRQLENQIRDLIRRDLEEKHG